MHTLFTHFTPLIGTQSVLIAVSGGVDSMVMLASLHEWALQTKNAPKIHVASVNHNLRDTAQQECELVADWCKKHNVPHRTLHWNHGETTPKTKLMEHARTARYSLLEAHAASLNIGVLITAHHGDDQAETLFMRLSKGSGLTGLCAMLNVRAYNDNLVIFRPFLAVEKAEILKIAADYNLSFCEDPSNTQAKFERVRMREKLKDSGISAAHLNLTIQRLQRAELALHAITDSFISHCKKDGEYFQLPREMYDHAPADVQIRILMEMVQNVHVQTSSLYPLSLSSFERLNEEFSETEVESTTRRTLSHCEISLSPKWLKVKPQTPRST